MPPRARTHHAWMQIPTPLRLRCDRQLLNLDVNLLMLGSGSDCNLEPVRTFPGRAARNFATRGAHAFGAA